MFDTRQYEWADITIISGGKDVAGARGIKYSTKQEKEPLYGKGNEPVSIQKGNKVHEGELTILQGELETMILNTKGKSVLDLRVDIIVNYGNPAKGDAMIVDVIKGVEFTEEPKEMKQGDKSMEITLPFIALRINKQTI